MAYQTYDQASPVGTQTGPTVVAKVKSNENALRDMVMLGGADGFDYSQSGGTASQPATIFFKNGTGGGAMWVKGALTWSTGQISQIDWSKSVNGGSSYDPICSMVPTYDINGNLTSTSGGGAGVGLLSLLRSIIAANAGGFNYQGEWAATSYPIHAVVNKGGSFYHANAAAISTDVPDAFEFRSIRPKRWMANNTYYEDTIALDSPQVFDSTTDGGANPQTFCNALVEGINLTTGGTLTIEWDTPSGSPLTYYTVLLFNSTAQGFGAQVDFVVNAYPGSPGTQAVTGLAVGKYFLVAYDRNNGVPNNVKLRVVASAGAVVGVAPADKWDQLSRSPVVRTSGFTRGLPFDEVFGTAHLSGVSVDVDWYNTSNVEIAVSGPTTAINFIRPPGSYSSLMPLKLAVFQDGGGGSLDEWIWTQNIPGVIRNGHLIPTNLGPNPGDSITVYFHFSSGAISASGGGSFYDVIGWSTNTSGRVIVVPTTGFTEALDDDVHTLILDPAGTLATGTVTLQANPKDEQKLSISSTQTITALTINANGNTVKSAVTTLGAGPLATVRYQFNVADTTWYPI